MPKVLPVGPECLGQIFQEIEKDGTRENREIQAFEQARRCLFVEVQPSPEKPY
jgi:hypothetical protein